MDKFNADTSRFQSFTAGGVKPETMPSEPEQKQEEKSCENCIHGPKKTSEEIMKIVADGRHCPCTFCR